MYRSSAFCFVAFFVTVAYGYPTVNDIVDFGTIRRLNQEKLTAIQIKDVNLLKSKLQIKEKDHEGWKDVPVVKTRPKFDESEEKVEDPMELDYLQPDWTAQDSLEPEEELDRVRRWASSRSSSYGFSSDDDSDDSHECHHDHHDHHDHHHHHGHDSFPDDSAPEDSWEDQKRVHSHRTTTRPSNEEEEKKNIVPTTMEPEVQRTISPDISTSTSTGRINIDPRFGDQRSEVRNKRMVWNVARSSDEFEDNPKRAKMRWLWDDQKPEVIRTDNNVDDTYVEKQEFFRPLVPVVNLREPCASKFERRDRHGRCRPAFLR